MTLRPRHLVVPVFVAVCGVLLYSIQSEVRGRTVATARAEQLVHARQAAQGIEGLFAQYVQMLGYLGSLPPVVRMDADGRALLTSFLARYPDVTAVTRMGADGHILYTAPENPGVIGADISSQAHVRTLLDTRRPVVSDVFQAVQGYRTVALHVPVAASGEFRGSLAVLIPFDLLARRFLGELRVGRTGHAWLVSSGGIELYCLNPDHIGAGAGAGGGPAEAAMVGRMVAGEQGTATLPGSGHLGVAAGPGPYLVTYTPARVADTSWSIAVAASEAEILEAAHAFRDQWMAAVGLLGAGLLLYAVGAVRTRSALRSAAERERAAAVLRSSYVTVRTILESIDADVYVADLETHEILFMNRRMQEKFGPDLEGKICWREFRGGAEPCAHCTNPQLVGADGEPGGLVTWEGQNPLTGRWYLNYDRAIRWVDGRTVRLQVATDITERRQAEEDGQRVAKLESLGVLAGGIAHDFNNLLMAVMGNLSLARLQVGAEGDLAGLLEEAERASAQAAKLTRQLLTFAKGGAPVKQLSSVAEVLREASGFVTRGSNSRVVFDLSPDLWAAEIDPGQIGQVIHNLVLNADHASPAGGEIHVGARNARLVDHPSGLPDGPYLEISVADRGTGIDPEHLARVFDPYFTTKGQGSGLGLATCHSIVRRHGGHIGASSETGRGTTFTLFLPAARDAAVPAPSASAELSRGRGHVLVMDDEPMLRDLVVPMLAEIGYRAEAVADGAAAVAAYREARDRGEPYDVVILDLTVPGGMGGAEAVEQLRRLDPGVRAVVSSGYAADPVLAEHGSRGFAAALAKPYNVASLGRALEEALGGDGGVPGTA